MELVSGLAFVGILVTLTLVLPVLSFYRARRAVTIAEGLRARLDALERRIDALAAERSQPAVDAELHIDLAFPRPVVVSEPHPVAEAPPPPTPVPPRPAPVASSADLAAVSGADLEQMIGGRWLLYVGVAALVLGMSYFVKFAFDNGWISERLRVTAGGLAGLVLIGAGVRFWSRGLALFGQALAGGGMVVLYVSIYAALHFYALLTPTPAFGLMAIVTAGAAYLADRQRSQPLAVLALLGGFATPLLVGGRQDSQVVLFTYIAILISGAALL
ncbi:MAG: DUF2339 domain-containing protein, partial [Acidobacteria bacterium]|nr:DUF2339 domain-containing protein [Acidobacteriota bacterium]